MDADGDLYGTSEHGGTSTRCGDGCGTVYKVQHLPDGTWQATTLYSFGSSTTDGTFPGYGDKLAIDGAGNLYGTVIGGAGGHGVIFRMSRDAKGVWTETVLHSIWQAVNGDGPSSGVSMDGAGNLYGMTIAGGDASCDCGVVFKAVAGLERHLDLHCPAPLRRLRWRRARRQPDPRRQRQHLWHHSHRRRRRGRCGVRDHAITSRYAPAPPRVMLAAVPTRDCP
jgi:uncharacterized repeat protein (TIGR03803 family)